MDKDDQEDLIKLLNKAIYTIDMEIKKISKKSIPLQEKADAIKELKKKIELLVAAIEKEQNRRLNGE